MKITIDITTDVDFTALDSRLTDAERSVFVEHESRILRAHQDAWVGWKYTHRPKWAPRLVSHDAWSSQINTTKWGLALEILNEARSWDSGEPYVATVKRKRSQRRPEWEVVTERAQQDLLPAMIEDLTRAITETLERPTQRRKHIADFESDLFTMEIEI